MMGEGGGATELGRIDWSAPWLAPYVRMGPAIAQQVMDGASVAQALNAAAIAPVRFVPQTALPADTAYEQWIAHAGQVPTRDGLHDFFNGLCWLHFPRTKQRLSQLHAEHLSPAGKPPVRGAVRDALTLFDENGAWLQAPDALWDSLVVKDWAALFGPLRPLWAQAQLLLFGHALLEKLVTPRKPITAHVYRVQADTPTPQAMDDWMAVDLSPDKLARKPFAHLPVLGVPGWWAANAEAGFYADPTVFRPPRATRG